MRWRPMKNRTPFLFSLIFLMKSTPELNLRRSCLKMRFCTEVIPQGENSA